MEFSEQYTYSKRTFIGAARQIRSTFHYLPNLEEKNPTQLCICTFWGPFFLKTYLASFFKNPALDMQYIYNHLPQYLLQFPVWNIEKNFSSQNDLFHIFVSSLKRSFCDSCKIQDLQVGDQKINMILYYIFFF